MSKQLPYPPNIHESLTLGNRPRRASLRRRASLKTAAYDAAKNQKKSERRSSFLVEPSCIRTCSIHPTICASRCLIFEGVSVASKGPTQSITNVTLHLLRLIYPTTLKTVVYLSSERRNISTTREYAHTEQTHKRHMLKCTRTRSMHQIARDKSDLDIFPDV